MRFYNILVIILIIGFLPGCNKYADKKYDNESNTLISEIELLSQQGIEIPEVVTPEDIERCKQAVTLAQTMGDEVIELHCLIKLTELQSKLEDYKGALLTAKDALALAVDSDDKSSIAQVYRLLGDNYYHLASFHKAFENLELALKLFTELKDTANIQDVMNIQGNIYFSYHDYDMAFSYYKQNLELSKYRNDNVSITKALTNIALIYSNQSLEDDLNPDSVLFLQQKAEEYINSALLFNKKTNKRLTTAEILFNLADIKRSEGKYEEALVSIKQALDISYQLSDRVHLWSSISYANILMELDSINAAESVLLDALNDAEESDLRETKINIFSLLSKIYNEKENYKLAYKYYTQYSYLSQEIFTIDYKKQIDAIKINSELEAVDKLQEIDDQQTFYQTVLIVFLLIAGLIIFILAFYRMKQRNTNIDLENKLLNERLETRNRELTTRIMALIQRNELDKELLRKLNTLKLNLKRDSQSDVQDIIRSLSVKHSDPLWKEFEVRFESVHNDFFKKLSNKYSELTNNEKRLCAFLFLDMSSKDISAITGQSIRALNVARTRLRKRFNLTNDAQTLSAFLNAI